MFLNFTLQEKEPWIIHVPCLWNVLPINLPNFKTELLLSLLITIWSHLILFSWALRTLQSSMPDRQESKTPLWEHPGSMNTGMFQKSFWISCSFQTVLTSQKPTSDVSKCLMAETEHLDHIFTTKNPFYLAVPYKWLNCTCSKEYKYIIRKVKKLAIFQKLIFFLKNLIKTKKIWQDFFFQ